MNYFGCVLALGVSLCASIAESQTFTTLVQFTGTSGTAIGAFPYGGLTLVGTTFYGMTVSGGTGDGNVFSVGINGSSFQNLISFTGTSGTANGANPGGSLIVAGTTLYGLTSGGGRGVGTVFSVGTNGANYDNLVSFTGTGGTAIGAYPQYGALALAGTNLYGMTEGEYSPLIGNIFSTGTNGTNYQNLVSFTGLGGAAPGSTPLGSLTVAGSTLFGMTLDNVGGGYGNVFSVGTNGTSYQNLVSFTGTGGTASGSEPYGSLILDGTALYGMTRNGGASGYGNVFSVGTNGSGYQNLLSFTGTGGTAIGQYPTGDLILSGTTLYGLTSDGGADADGNVFSVGIDGSGYDDLYNFTGELDGSSPRGDLTLSGGTLFGMAYSGGAKGDGTIFALTLAPTPEPGTLALAVAGATCAAAWQWRRRRKQRAVADPARNDAPAVLAMPPRATERRRGSRRAA